MIILASASPRRKEILSMITTDFKVVDPDIEEVIPQGTAPSDAVVLLARQKAENVFMRCSDDVIIASDTVVELEGEIFGKPTDRENSIYQLSRLSGKIHNIHTGVAVLSRTLDHTIYSTTSVQFDNVSQKEIEDYIATGETADKAGSYAIQGLGGRFVSKISGDYYTAVGLPLNLLYRFLLQNKVL